MRSDIPTDKQLIEMCLSGKEAGYTGLYNRYGKAIFNSICRIVGHGSIEAEDILQDSFRIIFSDLYKLDSAERFGGWAKRIAVNRAISFLRKAKIRFSALEGPEPCADDEYEPEDDCLFECKVEEVKRCIAELPPGYRMVVTLFLFENMPQEEIAQVMGVSHNTVRTQYHRAKKRILQQLNEKDYYG